LRDNSVENEVATPPRRPAFGAGKTKSGGSQRHKLAGCTVENL